MLTESNIKQEIEQSRVEHVALRREKESSVAEEAAGETREGRGNTCHLPPSCGQCEQQRASLVSSSMHIRLILRHAVESWLVSCESTYIPYSRKFWQEEYLADCSNNGIWRILLWRLGKPYTIIIFIAKW